MLRVRSVRQLVPALVVTGLVFAGAATPAHAQDVLNKDSAAAVKAYYLADLEALRVKFVGLAEAFPADKYSFRPMDGVRSTAEVLMLLATEGYGFAPGAVGANPAMPREEMTKLRSITDKAQIIDHLNKGFAYAKAEVGKIDAATLTGKRKMGNNERNAIEATGAVLGDMHEHLGQLIAYARMNKIVPPWSK